MNRVQSKGELLKMYQSEASDLRDKKNIEVFFNYSREKLELMKRGQ